MPRKDRKAEIIQAALKLFTSRRFHEVTTDDIAREAKVGKGTLYRYFADKDDIFFETANSGFDELCRLLRTRVHENAPFDRQLLSACENIGAFFEQRHRFIRMMQSAEGPMPSISAKRRERFAAKRSELVSAVALILARGVAGGEIRGDIPAAVLSSFLLAMLVARDRFLSDVPRSEKRYKVVIDVFMSGASDRRGVAKAQGEAKPGRSQPRRGAGGRKQ
jgi:AcrR family transcriptional regulator